MVIQDIFSVAFAMIKDNLIKKKILQLKSITDGNTKITKRISQSSGNTKCFLCYICNDKRMKCLKTSLDFLTQNVKNYSIHFLSFVLIQIKTQETDEWLQNML